MGRLMQLSDLPRRVEELTIAIRKLGAGRGTIDLIWVNKVAFHPALALVAWAACVLSACSDALGPDAPVATLSLTPTAASLLVGDTLRLHADPQNARGQLITTRTVRYQSSDSSIASVTSDGLVKGLSAGAVVISATVEDRSAQAALSVRWGASIGPAGGEVAGFDGAVSLTVPAGALATPTTIYLDRTATTPASPALLQGSAVAIAPAGVAFRKPAELHVTYAPGTLSAELERSIGLYAVSGGQWKAVAGSTLDVAGRVVSAEIDSAATVGLLAPGPVSTITIRPPIAIVLVSASFALSADLADAAGNPLSNRPVAWTSSDTTVVRVSRFGELFAASLGLVRVTAFSGGASGSIDVIVTFICSCPPLGSALGERSSPDACSCSG